MVIPTFARQALLGEDLTVYGDGKQTRCFAAVQDVVPAMVQLMETESICGEVFNIGNNESVSMEDLAKRIITRTKSSSTIRYVPYDQAYGPGYEDMRHREPCLDKINKAIGYKPAISLDEILDAVIEDTRQRLRRDV